MPYDLKKAVLEVTQYKNYKEQSYSFSASMSGNTVLQNYLTIVHGHQPDSDIGDNTLGSIFHLGMEQLVQKHTQDYLIATEQPASMDLGDWKITATADMKIFEKELIPSMATQDVLKEIHDFKLTKKYAVEQIKKDPYNHAYGKQLRINNVVHNGNDSVKLFIDAFIKDADKLKTEPSYVQIEVPSDNSFTIEQLQEWTAELQGWIESGEVPPKCDDVWLRKPKGFDYAIPSRCMFYCAHGRSGLCPHFKPNQQNRLDQAIVSNW